MPTNTQKREISLALILNGVNATDYPIYLRTTRFRISLVPQYGGYFHDLDVEENL